MLYLYQKSFWVYKKKQNAYLSKAKYVSTISKVFEANCWLYPLVGLYRVSNINVSRFLKKYSSILYYLHRSFHFDIATLYNFSGTRQVLLRNQKLDTRKFELTRVSVWMIDTDNLTLTWSVISSTIQKDH